MTIDRKQLVESALDDIRATVRRISVAARSDMEKDAIPRSQAYVMHLVNDHPGMSVKDVARSMDISASAATQLIEILVKEGILDRNPSEHDRRVVALELSKLGRAKHRKYKAFQLARVHPVMEALSDEELVEFGRLHRKIHEAMYAHPTYKTFTPQTPAKKDR